MKKILVTSVKGIIARERVENMQPRFKDDYYSLHQTVFWQRFDPIAALARGGR